MSEEFRAGQQRRVEEAFKSLIYEFNFESMSELMDAVLTLQHDLDHSARLAIYHAVDDFKEELEK